MGRTIYDHYADLERLESFESFVNAIQPFDQITLKSLSMEGCVEPRIVGKGDWFGIERNSLIAWAPPEMDQSTNPSKHIRAAMRLAMIKNVISSPIRANVNGEQLRIHTIYPLTDDAMTELLTWINEQRTDLHSIIDTYTW